MWPVYIGILSESNKTMQGEEYREYEFETHIGLPTFPIHFTNILKFIELNKYFLRFNNAADIFQVLPAQKKLCAGQDNHRVRTHHTGASRHSRVQSSTCRR